MQKYVGYIFYARVFLQYSNTVITGCRTDGELTMLFATELWEKHYRGRYAVRFINLLCYQSITIIKKDF